MIRLLSVLFHPTPADYENWLEKLALKGLYPKKISKWSSLVLRFDKKEGKKYRYVLDLQTSLVPDYIKAYESFGWELCGKITNAYLWRMEYEGKRPESFTDRQTLQERNHRFGRAMTVSFIVQILVEILITAFFVLNWEVFDTSVLMKYLVVLLLSYIYTTYLGVIMYRIQREGVKYGESTVCN